MAVVGYGCAKCAAPGAPIGQEADAGTVIGPSMAMGDGNHCDSRRRNDVSPRDLRFGFAPPSEARPIDRGHANLAARGGDTEIVGFQSSKLHRTEKSVRRAALEINEHMAGFRDATAARQNSSRPKIGES